MAVKLLNGLLRLVAIGHRHEGKAAGAASEFVEDNFDHVDGTNLAKQGFEVLGGTSEGQIPDVELTVFHGIMRADDVARPPVSETRISNHH